MGYSGRGKRREYGGEVKGKLLLVEPMGLGFLWKLLLDYEIRERKRRSLPWSELVFRIKIKKTS